MLESGRCVVTPTAQTVKLVATAVGQGTLDRLRRVGGGRLKRFGQRGEFVVAWR